MNYSDDFKNLIERSAERLKVDENDNTFIGAGNPMGKILFIGQECAIGTSEDNEKQKIYDALYSSEITPHICKWCYNIEKNLSQEDVVNDIKIESYNPLYPYKGKMFSRYNEKTNKSAEAITSTWYYYQKLYDIICGKKEPRTKQERVDFFEDCFMTELSHITAKNNKEANKKKVLRKASIESRKELFKEPFFQSFPIVIVAAGHYPRDNGFDIQ